MTEITTLFDGLTLDSIIAFVKEEVKTNDFFAAAGLAGILSAFWIYFKGVPKYLWERIRRKIAFKVSVYETDEFYQYFEEWLRHNYSKSYRNVEAALYSFDPEEKTADKNAPIPESGIDKEESKELPPSEEEEGREVVKYKQFTDTFFIRKGLLWLKIFKGREQLENASDLRNAYLNRFEVSGLFAKRVITKFMQEVVDFNVKLRKDREKVEVEIHNNTGDYWQLNDEIYPKTMDKIILKDKESLLTDVDNFLSSKKWYKDRSIMYKRGYMFYGKPGNGKTTLAMALSLYTKRDLYMMTIDKDMSDSQMMRLFRNLSNKSVLVIEDIDAMFGTHRDVKSKFSFSTLLNCLDGVLSKEDVIVIFTTNHPENLDPALIRAGRVDFQLEVSNPHKEGIEEYLNIFYEKDNSQVVDFEENENLCMVKVQDICLQNKENYEQALEEINKILKT